jgi:hypothetical protein
MTMPLGMRKDLMLKVTATMQDGTTFTFEEPQTREAARELARTLLRTGFNIDSEYENIHPGEEVYYPPASIYKVAIHK